MEDKELDESNEASVRAVSKLEGDGFASQDEDSDKQSEEEKMPNIGHDDAEFCNEQDDVSPKSLSSQDDEKVEGDAYVVQNKDHGELRQEKIQDNSHDGSNNENEHDRSSDMSSTQGVENMEGDTYVVQNEDHDGSKYENEHAEKLSGSSSSEDVENMERNVCVVQNEDHEESKQATSQNICHNGHEYENEQDDISSEKSSSSDVKNVKEDTYVVQNDDHIESKPDKSQNNSPDVHKHENEVDDDKSSKTSNSQDFENRGDTLDIDNEDHEESKQAKSHNISHDGLKYGNEQSDISSHSSPSQDVENLKVDTYVVQNEDQEESDKVRSENISHDGSKYDNEQDDLSSDTSSFETIEMQKSDACTIHNEDYNKDPNEEKFENLGYDGPGFEKRVDDILENIYGNIDEDKTSNESKTINPIVDVDPGTPHVVEKALALRNFVREKSLVAVSTLMRRLSRKVDEDNSDNKGNDVSDLSRDGESKEVGAENKTDKGEEPITESPLQPIVMKGRIILYTRLGCRETKEVRKFLYMKRLRYVEINIDVYPNRKIELEKVSGSTSVPIVFFNEVLIGDLSKLEALNESGKLDEKIEFIIAESPSFEAPVPPLSGEDDVSTSGPIDEMALIVRKMKESIVVKDRFSKLRRFTNCFLGCEAVDFLSENQYLERKEVTLIMSFKLSKLSGFFFLCGNYLIQDLVQFYLLSRVFFQVSFFVLAVEFGRKLAIQLFFQHVLDENIFEDGNFLYRFLDDDPIVASQCQNIPKGITTVKPKPIKEIASRLRLLSYAMFEAYASEDGRHVDYRSMHGSEEFARYLRIVEELQRVEIMHLSREETIAFFINLYNMMTIHAILVWGHPTGALERRKMFGDFKYIIGGSTYSLSAIQNGVLRGNQRQPYTLMRPFGAKDKRLHVSNQYSLFIQL
ncbi:putative winged helix-turn-helix DNA-binding domain, thioredoxin-like protein [Medicago truncatula]|uniref:Putative winged helix-turn-helix DNA-binding domain, thioredoxin-like protein n=1 Tax=Medicago truncatula TaxID=3880 RepID=A0A396HVP2_MEDTR|nr:putative winged helix-turn-helix DNA-binding domain, thioredoxin-like protein [Medicago truncatula]